jgi:hypothetical protein
MAAGRIPLQSVSPYRGGSYKEGIMPKTAEEIRNEAEEKDRQQRNTERLIKQATEAAQGAYTEAPVSFNVDCYFKGFKCKFTVRNGDPAELAKKIPGIISYLERIGATPTPGAAAQAAAAADPAAAPQPAAVPAGPVCECGEPGVFVAGENERGPWSGYKCPRCDEFIKGTFRRGKTYASERVPLPK